VQTNNRVTWLRAIRGLAIATGFLSASIICGVYAAHNYPTDQDTQAFAWLFYMFVVAPVLMGLFWWIVRTVCESALAIYGDTKEYKQYVAGLATVVMLFVLFAWAPSLIKPVSPTAIATTAPVLTGSLLSEIGKYTYPGMAVMTNNSQMLVAKTSDSYSTVAAYFNQLTGQTANDCSSAELGCSEWTVAGTDGKPIIFSVAESSTKPVDYTADPTTPPALVTTTTVIAYKPEH
jgi:hypothetical protein